MLLLRKKKPNRRNACDEASHGFSQVPDPRLQSHHSRATLGTGSPPLIRGVCAGPWHGRWASVPGNTKMPGGKVCILLLNSMRQLSENTVLLKNWMSEVKIKNNPVSRHNVRY